MLKVEGLWINYGKVPVIKGINMSIEKGEFVTIIGSNGAGKTTILRAISGLLPISGGSINFKGNDIAKSSPEKIVSLGMAHSPEGRRVWPHMTVYENLMLGAYVFRSKKKKEIIGRLEMVYHYFPKLKERKNQSAGSLSGGEQQMLAIGRALMSNPEILLMDEPSLGLAPIIVEKVAEIIKKIHEEGNTILLVEQNAYLALKLADRAYVLETGKIVLEGPAGELIDNEHVRKAYLAI